MATKITKKELWMDGIKDADTSEGIGIEIVCRLVIDDEGCYYNEVEEILEKAREFGAAKVTQRVKL